MAPHYGPRKPISLFYDRPVIHPKPLINQASARNSPQLITSAVSGVSARTTSEISKANSPEVASRKGVFTFDESTPNCAKHSIGKASFCQSDSVAAERMDVISICPEQGYPQSILSTTCSVGFFRSRISKSSAPPCPAIIAQIRYILRPIRWICPHVCRRTATH